MMEEAKPRYIVYIQDINILPEDMKRFFVSGLKAIYANDVSIIKDSVKILKNNYNHRDNTLKVYECTIPYNRCTVTEINDKPTLTKKSFRYRGLFNEKLEKPEEYDGFEDNY